MPIQITHERLNAALDTWREKRSTSTRTEFLSILCSSGVNEEDAANVFNEVAVVNIETLRSWLASGLGRKGLAKPAEESAAEPITEPPNDTFQALVDHVESLSRSLARWPSSKRIDKVLRMAGLQRIPSLDAQSMELQMAVGALRAASLDKVLVEVLNNAKVAVDSVVSEIKQHTDITANSWKDQNKHSIHLDKTCKEVTQRMHAALDRFRMLRSSLQGTLSPLIFGDLRRYDDAFNALNPRQVAELEAHCQPITNKSKARISDSVRLRQTQVEGERPDRVESLQRLQQEATANSDGSAELVERLASVSGGHFKRAPLKGVERMIEKTEEDNCGDYLLLCDIDRNSIEFDDLSAMMAGVDEIWRLDEDAKLEIVRVKLRLSTEFNARANSGGYRDILMNYRVPGSPYPAHISELQLHLRSFLDIKSCGGHATYKIARQLHIFEPELITAYGNLTENDAEMLRIGAIVGVYSDASKVDFDRLTDCLSARAARVEELTLMGCHASNQHVEAIVRECAEKQLLRVLDLNSQTPPLTSLPWGYLCRLERLQVLRFMRNDIKGPLPQEFFKLSNLRELQIQDNPIGGDFPVGFANLSALSILRARNCNFTGVIPESVAFGCRNLKWLALNFNRLEPASLLSLVSALPILEYADMTCEAGLDFSEEQQMQCEEKVPLHCRLQWKSRVYREKSPSGWVEAPQSLTGKAVAFWKPGLR